MPSTIKSCRSYPDCPRSVRTKPSALATRSSTMAPAGTGIIMKPPACSPRAQARVRSRRPSAAASTPNIRGTAAGCVAQRRTPPSTRSSKDRPHATPNCGCAPAGAKASSRSYRCMTPSNARCQPASRPSCVARLGCEAVQLEVPMRVDLKFGHSWGDARHTWARFDGRRRGIRRPSCGGSGGIHQRHCGSTPKRSRRSLQLSSPRRLHPMPTKQPKFPSLT